MNGRLPSDSDITYVLMKTVHGLSFRVRPNVPDCLEEIDADYADMCLNSMAPKTSSEI